MSKLVAVENHTGELLLITKYDAQTGVPGSPENELLVHPGTKKNLQRTSYNGSPDRTKVIAYGPADRRESVLDDAHQLEIPTAYGWGELREGFRHMDVYRVVVSGPRRDPKYTEYKSVEHLFSIYVQTGDGSNRLEYIKGRRDLDYYMGGRSEDWDYNQSKDNRLDAARDQHQLRGTPRKNGTPVDLTLHISKCKPGANGKAFTGYELTGFVKKEQTTEQKIAGHFKGLGSDYVKGLLKDIKTDQKGAAKRMTAAMNHPSTQNLRDTSSAGGYKSMAFVTGFDASLGVGGGFMTGLLMGVGASADTKCYLLTSEDFTIGAEEGAIAFEGLFLATEPPPDIGDHYEFFGEADVTLIGGVGIKAFWSFGGGSGLLVDINTGEELDVSVGIGCSQATLIPA